MESVPQPCVRFSKGDPATMCGEIAACNLVLARYHKLQRKGELPPQR